MQINYLGHSSFLIKTKTSSVVTDPYSPQVGFKMPKIKADIVTVSHGHHDHNFSEAVLLSDEGKKPFVINGSGEYEIKETAVFGLPSFHDAEEGKQRGGNIIYVISAEDINLCHLGDLGHQLSSKQIKELGDIDVLFIPVGGVYTLDPKQAAELAAKIEPRIVVPMHYKTSRHGQDFASLAPVDDFLKEMGVEKKLQEKLVLSKLSLGEEMEVVVLKKKS